MSTLSPDQWQAVSPYLDQALDMPDEERKAWLTTLGEQNPTLAAHLQKLLDEHPRIGARTVSGKRFRTTAWPHRARRRNDRRIRPAVSDRSGWNGHGVAGGAQRRPLSAPSGSQVPEYRVRGRRGAIQKGRQHRRPASPLPASRISSSSMSMAIISIVTATRTSSMSQRGFASSSTCSTRWPTRTPT